MASSRFTTNYEPKNGNIDVEFSFVKPLDAGVYVCKAENMYGSDETFVEIKILPVANVDETPQTINPNVFDKFDLPLSQQVAPLGSATGELQPPVVIIPLNDKLITEEAPCLLSCKIIGNPKPKVF